MECVILYRNTHDNTVGYVSDDDGIKVYRDEKAALGEVPNIRLLQAFPYQVVHVRPSCISRVRR